MACKEWNDGWVARLYDELDPAESRSLDEHLVSCDDCRETLEQLEQSRELIRSAIPDVPGSPRVLMLQGTTLRRPVWAFAAGIAAALLVFAAGLYAGLRLPGDPPVDLAATATENPLMLTRLERLEGEIAGLRAAAAADPAGATAITPKELDDRLAALERGLQSERVRDVEFLLDEIRATEWRAAHWVDENREALRLVALRNDPRLSER